MNHGTPKKTKKLSSWSKKLLRKWFNLKSRTEGQEDHGGDSDLEREAWKRKKSRRTEKSKNTERGGRHGRVHLDHPQFMNVQNYSVFVATWNLGGRSPSSNTNLDEFIHSAPPADIYVLGFQEIVPLNAGNILGAEDNGPAKKWLSLLRRTLNDLPGTDGGYPPSPTPNPVAESDADFEGSTSYNKSASFLPRRSYQATHSWRNEFDPSMISNPRLDRRYSVCDRVMSGHQPTADPEWSSQWGHRPSDYSSGRRMSDFSRWGSSDEDCSKPNCDDSPSTSTVIFSPMSMEDGYMMAQPRQSRYCLVASKQMVGVFLTVWVRSELREHVSNTKVSCVGRGLMGYLGNKGSISVSMSLHRTSFCFVCSHLTSGQKEGDELRRNADVSEILRKTRFPRVAVDIIKSPETILEHDRIIWLGDLNYRIALSHRSAKALVEMQNWRGLLENDQLRIEQRHGRVFEGWEEGKIYFPPTYKYSYNSDKYSVDSHLHHPRQKQRTPAWCDRILWYGSGLHQLSYVRGESRFSDHRPVYGIFWAEAESHHDPGQQQLRKSTSCCSSRIEVEELLPNGYTELRFF